VDSPLPRHLPPRHIQNQARNRRKAKLRSAIAAATNANGRKFARLAYGSAPVPLPAKCYNRTAPQPPH
jgi:hypothetical protein